MRPRIWLIAGPTASGKSALALRLAQAVGGEIVGADSMQLYADLRVLSARPSREDEAQAPPLMCPPPWAKTPTGRPSPLSSASAAVGV